MEARSGSPQEAPSGGWSSHRLVTWLTSGEGRPLALGVTLLVALGCVGWGDILWQRVQFSVFDTYQIAFPRRVERLPVVIVDIDAESLSAYGRWPWPRTRLARLVEATQKLGAVAIGLDMVMPEADVLSLQTLLEERPDMSPTVRHELAALPSNDALLVQALRRVPVVVGRAGLADSDRAPDSGPDIWQTAVRIQEAASLRHLPTYPDHITNTAEIDTAAAGHGYLNATVDADGVVRLVPTLVQIRGAVAPTFAVDILRLAAKEQWYNVYGTRAGVRGIAVGPWRIPTEADGRFRPYFSPANPQRRLSARAVLEGTTGTRTLHSQIALIGVTGLGLVDAAATPMRVLMDGIEIHAQVLENMLAGTRLLRPAAARWIEGAAFVAMALALILLPRLRPRLSLVCLLVLPVLVVAGSVGAFRYAQWLLDPSLPLAGVLLVLGVVIMAGYAATDQKRRALRAALAAEQAERQRMAGELQAARTIQLGMLPAPNAIGGLPTTLEFYAMLEPAREVGGDLYDAFMLDEHRFVFLIGDVAGKGIPAALFMALGKALYKSTALREQVPLDTLMGMINTEISRENTGAMFITALLGILDTRTGALGLCSAGHDNPLLLRPGEPPSAMPTDGGPPFCVLDEFPYAASSFQLLAGDTLLMLTDGVTEAHDPAQQLYGSQRVLAYMATLPTHTAARVSVEEICRGLYQDVKRFRGEAEPFDDITIMAVRYAGPADTLAIPTTDAPRRPSDS